MKDINLSYVVTTKNKFEFLKITLSDLIANRNNDEEIILIDGNSNDEIKKYLNKLYSEKKFSILFQKMITEKHTL